jgi:hypothetical protein
MEATTGRACERALDRAVPGIGAHSHAGAVGRARVLGLLARSSRRT